MGPTVVLISNFQRKGGVLDEAEDEFRIWNSPKFLKSDKHFLLVTGQHPTSDREKEFRKKYIHELNRNLKRCAIKKVSPQLLMGLLVIAVRKFASRYETVGINLMAVCLPKVSVDRKDPRKFIFSSLPSPGAPTFLYIPGDSYRAIQYAPNVVFPGQGMMTGGEFISLNGPVSPWPRPVEDKIETVVLTEWIGAGTREDTRRAAVADDYPLKSISDITGALSWPKDEPCPYYGYLVAIKADPDVINQIKNDPRYMVVATHEDQQEMPDEVWLGKLKDWLAARGMPVNKIGDFTASIQCCTREVIIDKLKQLLKEPYNPH